MLWKNWCFQISLLRIISGWNKREVSFAELANMELLMTDMIRFIIWDGHFLQILVNGSTNYGCISSWRWGLELFLFKITQCWDYQHLELQTYSSTNRLEQSTFGISKPPKKEFTNFWNYQHTNFWGILTFEVPTRGTSNVWSSQLLDPPIFWITNF